MKLDVSAGNARGSEIDRVRNRYWSYHCGSIIPSWLDTIVSENALWIYHDRIFYRREHSAWTEGWFYLGCAIELEHRASPVDTLRQLRRVVAKLRQPGYDFSAARLLDEEVTHLQRRHIWEIHRGTELWQAEVHQRMLSAHPQNIKLIQEIEAKGLPQGPAANLRLMQTIVGTDQKVKKE